jgi:enoyl-CoA hydratase/carnithine racemase
MEPRTIGQNDHSFADGRVLADIEDGVGLITFNQPKKMNAMSVEMWAGLAQILDAFERDEAVRVVVLTGAGPRAFGAGADISEFEDQRSAVEARAAYDQLTRAGRARLSSFHKPVIARIRGYCLGGGLAIAMQADLRIAAHDSSFGIPAAKLGIGYGFDMVESLVALVGPAHARKLLYTGDQIDAEEAARIGLVNQVVPDQELSATVVDIARSIADNAPLSVRALKLEVAEAVKHAADRDLASVQTAIDTCFASDDYKEGHAAFLEKRPPRFKGR